MPFYLCHHLKWHRSCIFVDLVLGKKIKNEPVFCLAGLYNYSPIPDKETGEMTGTFSIITRTANELMKKIHNAGEHSERMPLILSKELAHKWLKKSLTDEEIRSICSYCFAESEMEAWPVDTIVKLARWSP